MAKIVIIVSALGALVCGLLAAWKWQQSSEVQIDLGYTMPGDPAPGTFIRNGMESLRTIEPVDPTLRQANEVAATWEAMTIGSRLNRVAARWTAASVMLGAFSAVIGVLAA